jgi:hypothetical protein
MTEVTACATGDLRLPLGDRLDGQFRIGDKVIKTSAEYWIAVGIDHDGGLQIGRSRNSRVRFRGQRGYVSSGIGSRPVRGRPAGDTFWPGRGVYSDEVIR